MPQPKSSFTSVGDLIQGSLKQLNIEKNFRVYSIWKKWREIVGEAIAAKTEPAYVEGKTLVVFAANSVWMNELSLKKKMILEKIASAEVQIPIDNIRFSLRSR